MNKVILIGRMTKDAEVRYTQISSDNQSNSAVGMFTLAVDRRGNGADFISCKAFGKTAEFFEKYGMKGTKFAVEGHIQTGSYDKDGVRIYTTDVVVERAEFCESKKQQAHVEEAGTDEFMNIPDGIDEELPFG